VSIESRHGLDEPDGPPQTAGEKLQATGERMASCGGSIVTLGCSGFLLLVVVLIVIAVLSGGGSSTSTPTTAPAAKTNCEHPTAAEPCTGRALEEWHREHGEAPLRVQEGREAPDEQEQKDREAKEHEAEADDEAIREGQRLKSEAAAESG
jgi:hypothetical protein